MTQTPTHTPAPAMATYRELIEAFPLRPINDEHDYDNALEVADTLVGKTDLNEDQSDYLDVLTDIIQKYETTHHAIQARRNPIKALKSMMDEQGMTGSDLGRLLGNRQLGSLILTKKRELSKAHIRILAKRFKVRADFFL